MSYMPEPQSPDIGQQVARYRRAARISAGELAQKAGAGLTRSIVANLENGRKKDVSVSQLLGMALALGVSPADLLFDARRPYDPVILGDRDAAAPYASTTTTHMLARAWWGGRRVAYELVTVPKVLGPTDVASQPHLRTDDDAAALALVQQLVDKRTELLWAIGQHEIHLARMEAGEYVDPVLPTEPDIVRLRLREFRSELSEIDQVLVMHDVRLDRPVIFPSRPGF